MSERDNRDLVRVVHISSALSLGLMTAFLASTERFTPELQIRFSSVTCFAFAGAAVFSWGYWRTILGPGGRRLTTEGLPAGGHRRSIVLGSLALLLCVGTVFAFVLAMKDVSREKAREVLEGTLLAGFCLAGLGLLLWRIARFLETSHEAEIKRLEREIEEEPPA